MWCGSNNRLGNHPSNSIFAAMRLLIFVLALWAAMHSPALLAQTNNAASPEPKTFAVTGTIKEIKADGKTVIVRHEKIPGYMEAMTMPFEVHGTNELSGLKAGDQISFRLTVTDSDSWIDQIKKTGTAPKEALEPPAAPTPQERGLGIGDPMPDYTLTNELGKTVTFSQFKGTAYAFTFFFTRCPLPNYCPRLSKNFEHATTKLAAKANAPTNWHFFSITFDPEHDTPEVLKKYGETYHYDPAHWSFLTGSRETIEQFTHQFGFRYAPDSGFFSHNFITVIVDANGILKTAWPMSGDTSDTIVSEILKGTGAQPGK